MAELKSSPFKTERPALLRVAIPHFCLLDSDQNIGYGSSRGDAALFRGVALSRCIGSVLALARHAGEQLLSIADAQVVDAPRLSYPPNQLSGIVVDCHVFVTGDQWLKREMSAFQGRITVHQLDLDDPRYLPHAARDFLLADDGVADADLSLYLEDDLVIQDRLYVDKLMWFLEGTRHQFVLMPHRFELTADPSSPRFFVDGPMDSSNFPVHQALTAKGAEGRFWDGSQIHFDYATNPHSGSFSISAAQRHLIARTGLSNQEFVGPLETVATFTVLQHFPVMKSSWAQRDFLSIEHAHPSFLKARLTLSASE